MEEMKKRVVAIDMAKGIGMLWIMMAHSGNLFPLHKYFYQMYVPIFYVCSGLTFHEDSLKEEIKQVTRRLLLPYGIYCFVCVWGGIIAEIIGGTFTFKNALWGIISALYCRWCLYPIDVADNIMLNKYFGGAWFLPALFLASVCFIFIKHGGEKVKKKWCYYGVVVIAILLFTIGMSKLPILLPWSSDTMFVGALFMLCGLLLKRIDFIHKTREIKEMIIFLLFSVLFLLLVNIDSDINMSIRVYGKLGGYSVYFFTANAILSCILCLIICKALQGYKIFRILGYIGRSTLTIYSVHRIVYALFDKYIYSGKLDSTQIWWANCIKITLTLIVCLLIDFVYKRIKRYSITN